MSAFSKARISYRMLVQLGLLERFQETLRYEGVYWNLYEDPHDARSKLAIFHERYNVARPHWALVEFISDPAELCSVALGAGRQCSGVVVEQSA